MITYAYMKKAFEDAHQYNGKLHFGTFRKNDQVMEFVSDCVI